MLAHIIGRLRFSLRSSEQIVPCDRGLWHGKRMLTAITRVRNESLILEDTLDHVGQFADAIVAYDDDSTDASLEILCRHPKVALVIRNTRWQAGIAARLEAETRHRQLLLTVAQHYCPSQWIYCFDADERIVGDVGGVLKHHQNGHAEGIRVRLFDAYLTAQDQKPLQQGQPLLDSRQFFGPERRDILMFWRNLPQARFIGLDAREPQGLHKLSTALECQHYGKAISIAQWETTCDYYINNFPWENYGKKWTARKGQAVHERSDFDRCLLPWGDALFAQAVPI